MCYLWYSASSHIFWHKNLEYYIYVFPNVNVPEHTQIFKDYTTHITAT